VVLDRGGAKVTTDAGTWEADLKCVANGELTGMTVLQINVRGGDTLSLRCEDSALRLVLAARALLGLSWGRFISAPTIPARDREAARA
jgi:hypothetical protein